MPPRARKATQSQTAQPRGTSGRYTKTRKPVAVPPDDSVTPFPWPQPPDVLSRLRGVLPQLEKLAKHPTTQRVFKDQEETAKALLRRIEANGLAVVDAEELARLRQSQLPTLSPFRDVG